MAEDDNDINANQPPVPPNMEEMMKRFEEEMKKRGEVMPSSETVNQENSDANANTFQQDVFIATEPSTQREHQVRSDSYNDFVSIQPKFFERFGVLLIALFVAILLVGSCFVKYPEVVQANIKVQSVNAPKNLIPKTGGKVIKILKNNNDNIKKGENILYIESTAKHDEVLQAYEKINQLIIALDNGSELNKNETKSENSSSTEKNIDELSGLFYTIQIGSFSNSSKSSSIKQFQPLLFQKKSDGTIKYFTGIYTNFETAIDGKNSIVNAGVKDAFIKAFNNGKAITIEDAKKIQTETKANTVPFHISAENIHLSNFSFTQLGELQSAFQTFKNSYINYLDFQHSGIHEKKKSIIQSDLQILKALMAINSNQKSGANDELKYVEETSNNNQALYQNEVIAKADYVEIYLNYLSKKNSMYQYDLTSLNYNSQMNQKLRELMEIEEQAKNQEYIFREAVKTVKSQFEEWMNKYILQAPETGKLSYSTFLQENQMVEGNKSIGLVVPNNSENFVEMYISQNNYPKVKMHQSVLLKFPSFPTQDYGYVKGYVSFIAPVASDSVYLAKVTCLDGFKSSQKIQLNVKHGMTGVGEIILKDKTIMGRIISKFTERFENL